MSSTQDIPDLMKMVQQIAGSLPDNKELDLAGIVQHVTKSVSGMMGNGNLDIDSMTKSLVQSFENIQGESESPQLGTIQESKVDTNFKNPHHYKKKSNFEELSDSDDTCEDAFKPRTKDLHFNLSVNLEDFYNGKDKKLAIRRKRIKKVDGVIKIIEERKKIIIPIERGMRDEQIIRFSKEADELPGHETGDIVITLCENSHSVFEREGDNLFIIKNISLYEALAVVCNEEIDLYTKHLDGSVLKFQTGSLVLHQSDGIRKVEGGGMPLYKKEGN